jgi:hypothetical protein
MNDVQATSKFNSHLITNGSTARWETIAVIPELGETTHDSKYWGKDYFMSQEYSFNKDSKRGLPRDFFMAQAENYARYAIPSAASIRQLMQVNTASFE